MCWRGSSISSIPKAAHEGRRRRLCICPARRAADVTVGVLVMAYGKPSDRDDIATYYTDIRRGRPPTPEQLQDLVRRYDAIGGTFPLRAATEQQRDALSAALESISPGGFAVAIGFGLLAGAAAFFEITRWRWAFLFLVSAKLLTNALAWLYYTTLALPLLAIATFLTRRLYSHTPTALKISRPTANAPPRP